MAQCLVMKHQEGSDSFLGCEIGPEDSKPFEELAIRMAGMKNRWGVRFRRIGHLRRSTFLASGGNWKVVLFPH